MPSSTAQGGGGSPAGLAGASPDVPEAQQPGRVDEARLRLLELAPRCGHAELLRATIDEAERLTGSSIGFFHFVDGDEKALLLQTWSTNTLERMCSAEGQGQHYAVEKAGVWADALRFRRAVVHDQYEALPDRKGLPPGHARILREAVVPVFRDGKVCALLGVGNKPASYRASDVEALERLGDLAWDIAARKRGEEALRTSEAELRRERERLSLAVEAGKVGLWELDLRTGTTWRTLEHDQIFGYDTLLPSWGPADAVAHVVPEDRPIFERAFAESRRTGTFHYELRIQPAGRPRRWIVADGKVVPDEAGAPARMVGTVVDVTARREAEESVRSMERLYRTVAHHYPHGVVGLFDRELRLVLLDGMRPVLVPDPAAIVGKRPSEVARTPEAGMLERWFQEALDGGSGRGEIRAGDRTVEIRTHPVRDESGHIAMGLILTEDVTERRALEVQVATTSRLAALGTMVAGVAHEINNPLVGLTAGEGFAAEEAAGLLALLRSGSPLDREEACGRLEGILEALQDAQASGQRIVRIVRDMALLARPDAPREVTLLGEVVEVAMRWLPGSIPRAIPIHVEDAGAPPVEVARGQIEQVIVNLVTNAARAIPPEREGRIAIRLGPGLPGMARLEVADDGIGMPADVLRRIFDPFFTTRRVGQGTGLGLPVVHSIVVAHGGSISVASRPGEGTTFRVELPVSPTAA